MLGMELLEETGTSLSAGSWGHRADTAAAGDTAKVERTGGIISWLFPPLVF